MSEWKPDNIDFSQWGIDTERNLAVQFLRSKGVIDPRLTEWLIEFAHLCGHRINEIQRLHQEHLNRCPIAWQPLPEHPKEET